ncbi:uncharacterized protein LOC133784982 [Humulus lupulus]|uniref:uncharacterized protein LOC133784982 n=1 Tax=Humulus lupulus TaxID=3486 RepID=UPI002B41163B|nr:uncharacterized protein LOC133784982 [Humulus lupulus]
MTVTKYALKFDKLAKFTTDLVQTNETRVDRFVGGLKPMIAKDVEIVLIEGNNTYAQKRKGSDQAGQSSQDKSARDNKGNHHNGNKEWVWCPKCDKCKKHHQGECRANACYGCGKEGHIRKNCPQKTRKGVKEHHKKDDNLVLARVFALTKPQAEASTSMVSGQIFIAGIDCHVLIDYGATHSFVSKIILDRFNRPHEMHAKGFGTMLPTEEVVISRKWFRALPLRVDDREIYVDLIELDMSDFDVILGMDWLTKYNATIDCKKKVVVFKLDGEEPFSFMGIATGLRIPIISALEAGKMLLHGCMGFLASVANTTEMGTQRPKDTRIVRDYLANMHDVRA